MFRRWIAILSAAATFTAFSASNAAQPPVTRAPIPTAETQAAQEALLKEVFGKEWEPAANDAARFALASKLLKIEAENKRDDPANYVLLERARNVSIQIGAIAQMIQATDRLDAAYQVDGLKLKATGFSRAERLPLKPEIRAVLTESMLDLARDAIERTERFDIAETLVEAALASARKGREKALVERATQQGRQVREFKARHGEMQKAMARLAESPGDPEANLTVGLWYAAQRESWDEALSYLALGSDKVLAAASARELNKPADLAAYVAAADGWWDAAEGRGEWTQAAFKRRAAVWYGKAHPGLNGLAKEKAVKRLNDVESLAAAGLPAIRSAKKSGGEPTKQDLLAALADSTWKNPDPNLPGDPNFKLHADGTVTAGWHPKVGSWKVVSGTTIDAAIRAGDLAPRKYTIDLKTGTMTGAPDGLVYTIVK